ncbi:efflux RND transporter periplasmic adaptor subunit [Pedobacter sp. AW1-32]|uniref:efflux RND transporter periplasmic adaptor subunit n=1 Tax=Pedobacter sp. AW1-32 TaxID=3383026 RepID=UPI003FEFB6B6
MKSVIIKINSIFFLSAALLFVSCSGKDEKPESESPATEQRAAAESEGQVDLSPAQYKNIGLTLGGIEEKSLTGTIKVNGFIDVPPQNLVSISVQMGGIVRASSLLQGSSVRKGQIIAVLENQDFVQLQQDFLESKSTLELADSEYKRQQTLAAQNVNSDKILQQAKSQYQIALARLNALSQRLHLINIDANTLHPGTIKSSINVYAPIDGYVTKVNVNTGKFVNPNDVMFEIVNNTNLHVELKVFERDAARITKGQKVRFMLTNDPNEYYGTIQLVGGEINTDKTVTVHAIADKNKAFIPGTYLKAFIETGSNAVKVLPEAAVVDFQGTKYIFLEQGQPKNLTSTQKGFHFYKMTSINVGIAHAGYVEITNASDIEGKNNIVFKGAYDLLSKMKNSDEE